MNPQSTIRKALYEIGLFLSLMVLPVMGYLVEQEKLNVFWLGLVSVFSGGIFALARRNVTPDEVTPDEE